jgi:translocation and assembly module TamA
VLINTLGLSLTSAALEQPEFRAWRNNYPLKSGGILLQAVYENEKKNLLATALRLGYFDARFTSAGIVIDRDRTQADVSLIFNSGNRYRIGDLNLTWTNGDNTDVKAKRRIEADILTALIELKEGAFYSSEDLSQTQQNLSATPYFSNVDVQTGRADTEQFTVPIDIVLTPGKQAAYNFEVGVGTDTGIRGGVGYENRRLNSNGHTLSARLGGSEIKRSAIVNYRVPLPRKTEDSLNFFTSIEEELGDSRSFRSTKVGSELSIGWRKAILKYGLVFNRERFVKFNEELIESETVTDLLMPSVHWQRMESDDLYFPERGWSASAILRVADKNVLSDLSLAQAILEAKGLYPLGVGRIRARIKVGASLIDEAIDLPASLGFLAGGDDSVRGYKFESIGVQNNGITRVGKNLVVGSVEYQHPLRESFALATFVDIGDAFDSGIDLKKGVGVGLRWRLPFGALRLDLASALDREGDPVRLHFSFGTDL